MICRTWFGVLGVASWLSLTACTSRQPHAAPTPEGASATAAAMATPTPPVAAPEAVVTCESLQPPAAALTGWAGLHLEVFVMQARQSHDPARVSVTLEDGAGVREIPGDMLAIHTGLRQYQPNCGVYQTSTRDTLHLTVRLDGGSRWMPTEVLETTIDLPLRAHWIYGVRVMLGRRTPTPVGGGTPVRILAIPPRAGEIAGDSLFVFVSGRSLSHIIIY